MNRYLQRLRSLATFSPLAAILAVLVINWFYYAKFVTVDAVTGIESRFAETGIHAHALVELDLHGLQQLSPQQRQKLSDTQKEVEAAAAQHRLGQVKLEADYATAVQTALAARESAIKPGPSGPSPTGKRAAAPPLSPAAAAAVTKAQQALALAEAQREAGKIEAARTEQAQDATTISTQFANRVTWVVLASFHTICCLSAMLVAFGSIYIRQGRTPVMLPRVVSRILLPVLMVATIVGVGYTFFYRQFSYMDDVIHLLDQTAGRLRLGTLTIAGFQANNATTYMKLLDGLSIITALLLTIAACATLMASQEQEEELAAKRSQAHKRAQELTMHGLHDRAKHLLTTTATELERETVEGLSAQMRQLRLLLLVGTIVLISGLLHMSAVLNWSLAFVDPARKELYAAVNGLTTSLVGARGVLSTLLLAAMYVPAATIVWRRAYQFALEVTRDTDNTSYDWLKSKGFTSAPVDELPRLVAILAPLLAVPLKDFIGIIGQK